MTNDIILLGNHSNNAATISPEQCLQNCLENYVGKRGAFKKGKKLIVLALDDTEGEFNTNFTQAGMKNSEILALLTVMKSVILEDMEY